ncbi:hypothetical protein BKA80DRAFT_26518 [Phyllosticta citrichinensis]
MGGSRRLTLRIKAPDAASTGTKGLRAHEDLSICRFVGVGVGVNQSKQQQAESRNGRKFRHRWLAAETTSACHPRVTTGKVSKARHATGIVWTPGTGSPGKCVTSLSAETDLTPPPVLKIQRVPSAARPVVLFACINNSPIPSSHNAIHGQLLLQHPVPLAIGMALHLLTL